MTDTWDPAQYHRFQAERQAPAQDLLALIEPVPGGRVLDLGCGTGELTRRLHERAGAASTLGVDSSPAMLAEAQVHADAAVRFVRGDLAALEERGVYDLIFAHASLQWVPDHAGVLAAWTRALVPGGQIAVQMPANGDHPSHVSIADVLGEEPFRSALSSPLPDPLRNVLPPERYAELLHGLAYCRQHVRLQVYGHVLADTTEVIEWVKGTNLTRVRAALDPIDAGLYPRFVARYREVLLQRLGLRTPYFYAFKRILFWARLPPA